jgi:hypothetical protein
MLTTQLLAFAGEALPQLLASVAIKKSKENRRERIFGVTRR